MASPPGILVPYGGSNCAKCMYLDRADDSLCANRDYIAASFKGKKAGDNRFVDGKTGLQVLDPKEYCCNMFDWHYDTAQVVKAGR
jgi:hypothetical protein